MLAGAAVVLGVVGGVWLVRSTSGVEATDAGSPPPSAEPSASEPSAPEPTPSASASPSPVARSDFDIALQQPAVQDAPVEVAIADVGLDLAVVPVGVRADGQMEIPTLVTEVGWYEYGPAPGAPAGSAVLSAHVDSELGRAPMAALLEVEPGALVEVTTASGAVLTFRVDTVEQLGKQQLPLDELFARDGPPLLRLVTCAGAWDPAASAYEDNLIVTATPVTA
ncbi:class F sortase [Agrococcus jejuensis]|uniref:Sortase family protein n=1 Tax=Agrococcus jejuensis TaxID=399736 RepID=A0A1G8DL89_9MICO|nr:class F sortase [Agrococcus jejuensis]SDH58341.1 Sortase family protein [Agrococcus jejuensis]